MFSGPPVRRRSGRRQEARPAGRSKPTMPGLAASTACWAAVALAWAAVALAWAAVALAWAAVARGAADDPAFGQGPDVGCGQTEQPGQDFGGVRAERGGREGPGGPVGGER